MIRYGICIGDNGRYERCAKRGLERIGALERAMESRGNSSIFAAYNLMLDEAREDADLEALVLLHDDLELRDREFEDRVREALAPGVAVVGAIGGAGVRGLRWSRAEKTFGRMPDAFDGANDHGGGTVDVDQIDGCLMILSPWAVHNLRFDEDLFTGFHAYDADLCMQARAAGKRVLVAEFDAFHHTGRGLRDWSGHRRAERSFREKWGLPRDSLGRRVKDFLLYGVGLDRFRR